MAKRIDSDSEGKYSSIYTYSGWLSYVSELVQIKSIIIMEIDCKFMLMLTYNYEK